MDQDFLGNLERVRDRIVGVGGDLAAITVVAVTKGYGMEEVRLAAAAGLDLGENYIDELHPKMAAARALQLGAKWHFLGAVQRNKVRKVALGVAVWQGVDRLAAGAEIARRAPGAKVMVQVNLTGAPQRNGCGWDDVAALVPQLRDLDLDVVGLMGVGPEDDPEAARPLFRRLASTARDVAVPEVSMGMSDDLEVAVEEGATVVRLGRALFGARPQRPRGQKQ